MANTLGKINPFCYRSYVYDEETGLYYLRNRYYDASKERFINADICIGVVGAILNSNIFAYCLNNPVGLMDSDGNTASPALRTKIHNAVCLHICATVPGMIGGVGMKVVYLQPIDGKTYGYYDLVNVITNEGYEVKRVTISRESAERQLRNYILGVWRGYSKYFPRVKDNDIPKLHPGRNRLIKGSFTYEEYEVSYWFAGNGIIYYDYTLKQESTSPQTQEQEEESRVGGHKPNLPYLSVPDSDDALELALLLAGGAAAIAIGGAPAGVSKKCYSDYAFVH